MSKEIDYIEIINNLNEWVNEMSKEDRKHLQWIHDRIISVYGESENVDFLIKMREIIKLKEDESS